MQFEEDMVLREQEEMLNAMQYEQQMIAQQFMQQQQQGYNMGGGSDVATRKTKRGKRSEDKIEAQGKFRPCR